MECREAGEHLSDLNRGRLEAGLADVVRAHVEQCVTCRAALQTEAEVRALVQAQAPRYTAPAELRARLEQLTAQSASPEESVTPGAPGATRRTGGSRWREWVLGHPWMAGSLAGAVGVLLVWGTVWQTRDPVSQLVVRAVAEHVEYAKEAMNKPAPGPQPLVEDLRSQVNFAFEPVFLGDSQVQLVASMVSELPGKRAATFVYRDALGRYTTLFLMPEAGTVVPAEGRMPIETFKPHHRIASGRHLLLWKQRELACLIVSDLDEAGLAAMFLKIRKAA